MNKLRALYVFYLVIICTIVIKLFVIQILASEQFLGNDYLQTLKINPLRGSMYDINKQPLVSNQMTYKLYAEPKNIKDKDETIRKLDGLLHIGEVTLSAKINSGKSWVGIMPGLDKKTKDSVVALKLKGLGFDEEQVRFYPEASLSAHLTGFVGKNIDGDNVGYFGLEGFYDKDLSGLPGILKTERDLFGNPIFVGIQNKMEGENGQDLILSIDKTVQFIAKEKLAKGMEKYQAKEGCVVVADPNSMQIIALTCLPDFDPSKYGESSNENFKNPIISTVYEPGSIFKPLIMAAAINENAVRPNDIYDEEGPTHVGKYEIQTWDNTYEGKITITRILEKSSNPGMVYIGQKLGQKKLLEYLQKYGLGEATDIDLQGEATVKLKPEKLWHEIDYSTATFGQGLVVTPIQMIRAFAAVINGGKLLRPYVVSELDGNGIVKKKIQTKVVRQVLDERTSIIMRGMLQNTVDHAEAKWDRPQGYKIGGKTGTAQVAVGGRYDASKTNASFIGFAPADKPRFIILTMFKEPQTSQWGSETAAPLFFDILRELLLYYNIAPE